MLLGGILLFASAVSVLTEAQLRAGCEASDQSVVTLPAGTGVELRFAISGSAGTCYKISAVLDGRPVSGYLLSSQLIGLEAFEQSRQQAPAVAVGHGVREPRAAQAHARGPANHQDDPLTKASSLLRAKQPRAALELLQKGMQISAPTYDMLLLAGLAARESDEARLALEYLTAAEQIKHDKSVERMIDAVRKELAGDRSGARLYGTRFVLRYDSGHIPSETARVIVGLLEEEFSRVSVHLGCRTDERITTVVQSREAYRASVDAAEWSGGMYDGRIRVPVLEGATITAQTRQVFSHEVVHACLAGLGTYPTWLHEGFAHKLSGESLSPGVQSEVTAAIRARRLPALNNMSQSWSRLSSRHAQIAYAYARMAVDLLYEHWNTYGIQNVLRYPERISQIALELDQRLAQ